jgi:hypothetical protein
MRVNHFIRCVVLFLAIGANIAANGEDGYRLWLRYDRIADSRKLQNYRQSIRAIVLTQSPTGQ